MPRSQTLPVKPYIAAGGFLTLRILSQPRSLKQSSRSALGRPARRMATGQGEGLCPSRRNPAPCRSRDRCPVADCSAGNFIGTPKLRPSAPTIALLRQSVSHIQE
jgi:hypothetical protein